MNKEKVGIFIAKMRKRKHVTQVELGDILGVSDKSVSKWERGVNYPDIELLISLSEFLEVNLYELLNGELSNEWFCNKYCTKALTNKLLVYIIYYINVFY